MRRTFHTSEMHLFRPLKHRFRLLFSMSNVHETVVLDRIFERRLIALMTINDLLLNIFSTVLCTPKKSVCLFECNRNHPDVAKSDGINNVIAAVKIFTLILVYVRIYF